MAGWWSSNHKLKACVMVADTGLQDLWKLYSIEFHRVAVEQFFDKVATFAVSPVSGESDYRCIVAGGSGYGPVAAKYQSVFAKAVQRQVHDLLIWFNVCGGRLLFKPAIKGGYFAVYVGVFSDSLELLNPVSVQWLPIQLNAAEMINDDPQRGYAFSNSGNVFQLILAEQDINSFTLIGANFQVTKEGI